MSAGRKKDPIWVYYKEKIELGKKGSKAVCNLCQKEMQGLVSRMKIHHEVCVAKSDVEKEKEHTQEKDVIDVTDPCNKPIIQFNEDLSDSDIKSKKFKTANINSFIVKTPVNVKETLDLQVAKFFYSFNIPFRAVENPHFANLMQMLRPGYKPPSKIDISNRLLNAVYENEVEKITDDLCGQTVCMSVDGWSNIHNQPLLCACVTAMEGHTYLVDTIDTSLISHSGNNYAAIIEQTIINVEKKFKCKVGSFVTDNAPNMRKMQAKLNEKFNIISYGCSAHLLNLLAKDLQDSMPNVTEHVLQVITYFRNHQKIRAKYKELKGTGLIQPTEVRWNSMCDTLENYIKNWSIFMQVCEDNRDDIDTNIKSKVMNMGIKRNAEDMLAMLKPISVALDKMQKDNCSLSNVVNIWKNLKETLKDYGFCKKFLNKRYEKACTPAHFLAFLLDPSSAVQCLTVNEKDQALNFVKEKYGETSLLSILLKFLVRSPPFNETLFDRKTLEALNTLEWWRSIALLKNCIDQKEFDIIQLMCTAKGTTAGIERMFSTFGLVHSKLRNQLGVEKSAKLVCLFKSLNKTNEKK